MSSKADSILIELGYDLSGMDKGATEALAKQLGLLEELEKQSEKFAHGGHGLLKGLQHNLKHLKKEAGLIGSYVGAFMGSEMASGFQGSLKEGIAGAIGGMFFGGQFGPIGAGIGAVVGATVGFGAKAIEEYAEMRKGVAELRKEFYLTTDAAEVFYEAGKKDESFKKTIKDWIELMNEYTRGTEKAKTALDKLLGAPRENETTTEMSQRTVDEIEKITDPVQRLKAKMGLPGGEEKFDSVKKALEEQRKKTEARFFKTVSRQMPGGGTIETQEPVSADERISIQKQLELEKQQQLTRENIKNRATTEFQNESPEALKEWVDNFNEAFDLMKQMNKEEFDALEEQYELSKKLNQEEYEALEDQFYIAKQLNQEDAKRSIDDANQHKFTPSELANLPLNKQEQQSANRGLLNINGPSTQFGRNAVLWAREALNARTLAKNATLNGDVNYATNRTQYADKIEAALRTAQIDQETPLQAISDKLDALTDGSAKFQVSSGGGNK